MLQLFLTPSMCTLIHLCLCDFVFPLYDHKGGEISERERKHIKMARGWIFTEMWNGQTILKKEKEYCYDVVNGSKNFSRKQALKSHIQDSFVIAQISLAKFNGVLLHRSIWRVKKTSTIREYWRRYIACSFVAKLKYFLKVQSEFSLKKFTKLQKHSILFFSLISMQSNFLLNYNALIWYSLTTIIKIMEWNEKKSSSRRNKITCEVNLIFPNTINYDFNWIYYAIKSISGRHKNFSFSC